MEKDSVSPAIIHNDTNAYQYHVVKMLLRKAQLRGTLTVPDSGTRATASDFSSAVRYFAFVVVGVSGKTINP